MPLRCGKWLTSLVTALSLSAHAQEGIDDATWLSRSRQVLEEAASREPPPWLRIEPDERNRAAAEEVASAALVRSPRSSSHQAPERVLIFASVSVPRATLTQLLEEATQPNVVLVLRGIPDKSTVPDTLRRLRALVSDATRTPEVILDPTLFRQFKVVRVPTFVLQRSTESRSIRVQGAVTVAWLRRMASVARETEVSFGRRAEDYEIAETDLIEEMQARLTRIDWSARREAARSTFWERQRAAFVTLPEAPRARRFVVNPSVRVTQDVLDADGHRLIAAGETFNPLRFVPLSKTLIVFDGTSEPQVRTAKRLAQAVRRSGKGVILLATAVETERGWAHLGELEQSFESAVYLLPQALVQRFEIKRIPATIVSRAEELLVTEVPVTEAP